MNHKTRKTVKIDTDDAEDRDAYDAILNDPMCTIVKEIQEKLTTMEYNEDGKPSHKSDRIVLIVTYEKKELL
jgi:hypothetical protein